MLAFNPALSPILNLEVFQEPLQHWSVHLMAYSELYSSRATPLLLFLLCFSSYTIPLVVFALIWPKTVHGIHMVSGKLLFTE